MKEDMLNFFACPHKIGAKACHNKLTLGKVYSYFAKRTKEIKEGYLECGSCGSYFPIFLGIPILTDNICEYLRYNLYPILELSKRYGRINDKLIADSTLFVYKRVPKKDRKKLFYLNKKESVRIIKKSLKNPHLVEHYSHVSSLINADHPLYDLVNKYKDITPYQVLEDFRSSHLVGRNDLTLDIGCGFGGGLKRLSQNAKFVFGLDVDFFALFSASCTLKHIPKKTDSYRINIYANTTKRKLIKTGPIDNLMFIVANGDNLPFSEDIFDTALSCNVFDVIDNPTDLLIEKIRVLKKGGLLLSSDPHHFSSENWKKLQIKKTQSIRERILHILNRRIKIVDERDNVPRIIYEYDRCFTIYLNYCFCGIKKK